MAIDANRLPRDHLELEWFTFSPVSEEIGKAGGLIIMMRRLNELAVSNTWGWAWTKHDSA